MYRLYLIDNGLKLKWQDIYKRAVWSLFKEMYKKDKRYCFKEEFTKDKE